MSERGLSRELPLPGLGWRADCFPAFRPRLVAWESEGVFGDGKTWDVQRANAGADVDADVDADAGTGAMGNMVGNREALVEYAGLLIKVLCLGTGQIMMRPGFGPSCDILARHLEVWSSPGFADADSMETRGEEEALLCGEFDSGLTRSRTCSIRFPARL